VKPTKCLVYPVLIAVSVGGIASADNLALQKSKGQKALVLVRGGEPVELSITAQVEVAAPGGDDVALAVHDDQGRPIMAAPEALQHAKSGRTSLAFTPTVQPLGADVKEVIVEAVLVNSVKHGVPSKLGEANRARLSYKVK